MTRRRSGISVPLFALPSSRSWGIGEFIDLAMFSRWVMEAGQSVIQILPINEMPPIESSPYSAMTAMALDPIYISVPSMTDFDSLGGDLVLSADDKALLDGMRQSPRIRYGDVRMLKERCFRRAFERFMRFEFARGTPRAARFEAFVAAENWWLDEYAVFRSLHALHRELPWQQWPAGLAGAEPDAVRAARTALGQEITYRKYLQWVAADQWDDAKRLAWPVRVLGDLPFMISADSPDVWARQAEFRFDATIGVPPDAFSETGQDWGLPPWRRDVMAAADWSWMRARARRNAALYDGYRIDHLVGLYRTYIRPLDKSPSFFDPPDEPAQIEAGETLVRILMNAGAGMQSNLDVIGEDLGVIPPFVRESMARLDLPGLKVLRWERHWKRESCPPIDPSEFPERSVATTGTHDVEPIAATEDGATEEQRSALLQSLLSSGSRLTLIPIQDVFGWTDRINVPAVVDDTNWTWRLPWPVDTWLDREDTIAHADRLRKWTRAADR